MLKKLFLTALCYTLASSCVYAKQLTAYEDIAHSLETGTSVLLNIKPEKCVIDPAQPKDERSDRLAIKLNDLYEWHSSMNGGKKMRVLGNQIGGIYGDKKFSYFRYLTLVYEDGTVMVFDDLVDPSTFNLTQRVKITCHLTTDGSGGVTVTQLPA
jgi:hypothetical protein